MRFGSREELVDFDFESFATGLWDGPVLPRELEQLSESFTGNRDFARRQGPRSPRPSDKSEQVT